MSFLLVDKQPGWTSHDVVAKVRRHAGTKVGHAGTLDPTATGLLVLGLGRSTRLLRFVQDLPKEYLATAILGVATDTLDAEGAVLSREPLPVGGDEVATVMARFVGTIEQVPPMVSARKVGGRRLYAIAREGREVERDPRPVTIHELELLEITPGEYPEVTFRVVCSSGTYVRTLADDIARALGGRAHLGALRRLRGGSLRVEAAHRVEEIVAAADRGELDPWLLDPAEALVDLPAARLPAELLRAVAHGRAVPTTVLPGVGRGPVRILDEEGRLVAVYRVEESRARPEVVMA